MRETLQGSWKVSPPIVTSLHFGDTYIYIYIYVCVCVCVCVCVYMYIYVCICIYIYIYILKFLPGRRGLSMKKKPTT